jgi:hypothetical protein
MSKPTYSVNAAAHTFLQALGAYQVATLELNRSLERLYDHLYEFSQPLKHIVVATGAALTPARELYDSSESTLRRANR